MSDSGAISDDELAKLLGDAGIDEEDMLFTDSGVILKNKANFAAPSAPAAPPSRGSISEDDLARLFSEAGMLEEDAPISDSRPIAKPPEAAQPPPAASPKSEDKVLSQSDIDALLAAMLAANNDD